ncbi:hypothetical protein MBAV_003374 [Candidatus Magnetobacterium bavaricum]|uniref:Uncharacterized protein n=1 Tax=Candidatus Magnetobacterium bavaricum TaxID=29290 RepID=A0A0F3GRA9_9BACT|nr:hypothetical protein MBAV_003374 [Candidatus Magnetobacterium bavaricum]
MAAGYYGQLYKEVKEKIFKSDHKYALYYVSSLAIYKVEKYIRNVTIDRRYNKARYHILMLFRMINESEHLPLLNSKKADTYCDVLINILNDDKKSLSSFNKIIEIIQNSDIDINKRTSFYQKSTTDLLIKQYGNNHSIK